MAPYPPAHKARHYPAREAHVDAADDPGRALGDNAVHQRSGGGVIVAQPATFRECFGSAFGVAFGDQELSGKVQKLAAGASCVPRDAKLGEQFVCLAITAKQHMLAVVDTFAAFAINKGSRAAAEARRLLDDHNLGAAAREPNRRRKPRAAGADDDDIRLD